MRRLTRTLGRFDFFDSGFSTLGPICPRRRPIKMSRTLDLLMPHFFCQLRVTHARRIVRPTVGDELIDLTITQPGHVVALSDAPS